MSGFKEERIDGCFFRATYSGKGGAYDLTAHYSLLMRCNDRAESPMRLCTTPSILKYTPEYLSFYNMLKSLLGRIEYLGTEGVHIRSKMSESTL